MEGYEMAAYIGGAPEPLPCNVKNDLSAEYIAKAIETRLKYCPGQAIEMIISAETAKTIIEALRRAINETDQADRRGDAEIPG